MQGIQAWPWICHMCGPFNYSKHLKKIMMIYFYIMLRISINSSPIRFLTSKCQNMCVCVCHVNCEMQSMAPNGSCHIMKLCYRIFFAVLRFFIAIDFPIKNSHRISLKISHRNHRFSKAPCPVSLHVSASAGRLGTTCNARCNSVLLDEHDGIHMIIYCMYVYIYIYILWYIIYILWYIIYILWYNIYICTWLYDYMTIWLYDYMIIWLYMYDYICVSPKVLDMNMDIMG